MDKTVIELTPEVAKAVKSLKYLTPDYSLDDVVNNLLYHIFVEAGMIVPTLTK